MHFDRLAYMVVYALISSLHAVQGTPLYERYTMFDPDVRKAILATAIVATASLGLSILIAYVWILV